MYMQGEVCTSGQQDFRTMGPLSQESTLPRCLNDGHAGAFVVPSGPAPCPQQVKNEQEQIDLDKKRRNREAARKHREKEKNNAKKEREYNRELEERKTQIQSEVDGLRRLAYMYEATLQIIRATCTSSVAQPFGPRMVPQQYAPSRIPPAVQPPDSGCGFRTFHQSLGVSGICGATPGTEDHDGGGSQGMSQAVHGPRWLRQNLGGPFPSQAAVPEGYAHGDWCWCQRQFQGPQQSLSPFCETSCWMTTLLPPGSFNSGAEFCSHGGIPNAVGQSCVGGYGPMDIGRCDGDLAEM